uniref:heme biosynthesis HemY N-terminal domain-containing protein n=1 Tax=Castellaniella defragrans TaxID=75697 RepID=UPI0033424B2E
MRNWFWTLILLVVAVALALVLREHGGNVLIIAQPWRIELSLSLAVVLLVAAFIVLHWLLRCIRWLGGGPERFRAWRGRRAQARDVELLESGWINVLEGRYAQAEKDLSNLLSHTRSADRKVLAGLSAARALHLLGEYKRRDQVLLLAREGAGQDSRLRQAVDTVTAEMYLDQNRPAEALALLEPLQDASSRYFHSTRLLLRTHRQLGNDEQVYALTRVLLRRSAIDQAQARAFIRDSVVRRFDRCDDEVALKTLWADLGADERLEPAIALAAARAQVRLGHGIESARILEAALGHALDDSLLRAYAQCEPEQAAHRLARAELWLKANPDHPGLLTALGQLCLGAQLWGQAEHYLERSLALRSDTHTYALLGMLDDALGRSDLALAHWRKASLEADVVVPSAGRLLPAADTRGDPKIADAQDPLAASVPESRIPEAASAAYVDDLEQAGPPRSAIGAAVAPTEAGSTAGTAAQGDDYFDTAPIIPGVDISQTSDGGSRSLRKR